MFKAIERIYLKLFEHKKIAFLPNIFKRFILFFGIQNFGDVTNVNYFSKNKHN